MSTTFPLATLSATVTAQGVTAPDYADILSSLKASFRLIYGSDAYLEPDSQDGQLLAVFALAVHDANQTVIAAYNAFSPATAVGTGLSSVVRLNHLRRLIPTRSEVNVTVTGVAGTTIVAGVVADADGNKWNLPATVIIPPGGQVTVTAFAQQPGAKHAPIGTVTLIPAPVAGWQTATNPTAATPGLPVESDAALRLRQLFAPAIASLSILQGITAALAALPGVQYVKVHENDTNATDILGLPPHSISAVIKGGAVASIAETIFAKKAPGVATYGTTAYNVTDQAGLTRSIAFFIPDDVPLRVDILLSANIGYTTAVAAEIRAAVAAYINALGVGESLIVSRLCVPALLGGGPDSLSYKLISVQAGTVASGTIGTADVALTFTQKAVCIIANVNITIV